MDEKEVGPFVDTDIVWEELPPPENLQHRDVERHRTVWAGLQCLHFFSPAKKEVLVRFEGFKDALDAKLFAEKCLRLRFEMCKEQGEAFPADDL